MIILPPFMGFYAPASGSTLWTPEQFDSSLCKLWLDANDAGTITKDGSNYVSQWNDKSGNGNHAAQSNGSYQPLYDSADKSVNFDSDELLISVTAKACIAVIRNANGSSLSSNTTPIVGTALVNPFIFLQTNSTSYTISVDGAFSSDTGDAAVNGCSLVPGNGTGTNISITGYVGFPTHDEADAVYWQINTARAWERLGSCNAGGQFHRAKIDFHEILLFSDALSTSDRQKCEGYLAHKWGYASKLPSDHPYKTNPPTV